MSGIARRRLLTLGGASLAMPSVAHGQSGTPKIGFLYPGLTSMAELRLKALREGLHAIGYRDADRVEMLVRASEGDPTKLAPLAADLVARRVDVLVPASPSAVRAAKAATTTIPIVANDLESDPVAAGFVASLSRPGGNITGVFLDFPEFGTKWVELLKEALPSLSNAVVLRDPVTSPMQLHAVEAAGRVLNVKLDVLDVHAIGELKQVFETAAARRPDAVLVLASPIFGTNPRLIADLALAHKLPTAAFFPEIARAGGLLAYGPDLLGTFVVTGTMVGKVLQGARPADLPVERPVKFEMVVNLKTARALGLNLPTAVLSRADDVIE
jgi:putative ABC transport system substrate-binding protein